MDFSTFETSKTGHSSIIGSGVIHLRANPAWKFFFSRVKINLQFVASVERSYTVSKNYLTVKLPKLMTVPENNKEMGN